MRIYTYVAEEINKKKSSSHAGRPGRFCSVSVEFKIAYHRKFSFICFASAVGREVVCGKAETSIDNLYNSYDIFSALAVSTA